MTLFADEKQDRASQKIRLENKELVNRERFFTAKLLVNLAIVDKDKLYCDYGYPSLYAYIMGDLGYTESEAYNRASTVRLMRRSKKLRRKSSKEGSV